MIGLSLYIEFEKVHLLQQKKSLLSSEICLSEYIPAASGTGSLSTSL